MARKHKNNFSTLLNASLTNVATTVTLLDSIPNFAASTSVRLTIYGGGVYEIIEIPQSGAGGAPVYTGVTRGCEGTTAVAWSSGARVECRVTAGSVDDKQDVLSGAAISSATMASGDKILIQDVSDSDNLKYALASDIATITNKWHFIDSKTASASSALAFTGLGDYAYIEFVFVDIKPTTDAVYFRARTSTNNGSSYDGATGDYKWMTWVTNWSSGSGTVSVIASSGANNDALYLDAKTYTNGNDTSRSGGWVEEFITGTFKLYSPASSMAICSSWEMLSSDAGNNPTVFRGNGRRESTPSTADVDAIQFAFSSGTIASGIIYAYGVRKS